MILASSLQTTKLRNLLLSQHNDEPELSMKLNDVFFTAPVADTPDHQIAVLESVRDTAAAAADGAEAEVDALVQRRDELVDEFDCIGGCGSRSLADPDPAVRRAANLEIVRLQGRADVLREISSEAAFLLRRIAIARQTKETRVRAERRGLPIA